MIKNPPGRPFIDVDWKIVDGLLRHQCTCEEIAGELGISADTLTNRIKEKDGGIYSGFSEYAASKKLSGKARLRSTQFAQALEGNTRMLDKLGDVYLGQSKEQEHLPPHDKNLEMEHLVILQQQEILSLKEQLDALKPKTDSIICGSNETIQHLDRSNTGWKDVYFNSEAGPSS